MKFLKYTMILIVLALCVVSYRFSHYIIWALQAPFYEAPKGTLITPERFVEFMNERNLGCKNSGRFLVNSRSPLKESSGLALSKTFPHHRYEINDSGNDGVVYLVEPDNDITKTIRIKAGGTDFESLDAGPCGDDHCIYVADTGNNFGLRDKLRLIRFREESPEQQEILDLSFPKTIGSEALLVHPKTGDIYLLSGSTPSELYKIPAGVPWNQEWTPEFVGKAVFGNPGGAVFSPDGKEIFILGSWGLGHIPWEKAIGGDLKKDLEPVETVGFHQPEAVAVTEGGHVIYTSETSKLHPNFRNLAISPCRNPAVTYKINGKKVGSGTIRIRFHKKPSSTSS